VSVRGRECRVDEGSGLVSVSTLVSVATTCISWRTRRFKKWQHKVKTLGFLVFTDVVRGGLVCVAKPRLQPSRRRRFRLIFQLCTIISSWKKKLPPNQQLPTHIFPFLPEHSSLSPTDGRQRLQGFSPQLDELYFTTVEKKILENCRCIVPNSMND